MSKNTKNSDGRPFVVYWNASPAPYMVERFNALADRGSMEFEAWFNIRLKSDRSWIVDESSWRFPYRYLPTVSFLGHSLHWPSPLLGRRPDVLVSLYAGPSFVLGRVIAKIRGIRVCYRVLKTYDAWVKRHPAKEVLKRILFKNIDGVETPGQDGKKYAMKYGVPGHKVFIATHTVDQHHYGIHARKALDDRDNLRKQIGVKGTVFIYVGKLWWGKGVDSLMEAFAKVQDSCESEVSLLLVGEGAEEAALRRYCQENMVDNVIFAGHKQKDDLPYYYSAADVFVFPTLGDPYGVVVDEAMACSLPVISSDAAGEIRERVENGNNGYVVGVGDIAAMADHMLHLANEPEIRKQMGINSLSRVAHNTPEQWAEDFEAMINSVHAKR